MTDDIRLAIILNPALPLGLAANTAGAVAIGLGVRFPALAQARLTDLSGRSIDISADRPVPILQAEEAQMHALLQKALPVGEDRSVVVFPAFARALHAYADYEAAFPDRDLAGEVLDGVGLAGPSKWVKSLTGSLKLLR